MRQLIDATEQKRLLTWLKQQAASHKRLLNTLTLLATLAFLAQGVLFWYIAAFVQNVIIDTDAPQPLATLLTPIVLSMIAVLSIEHFHMKLASHAERQIFSSLQTQLWQQLSRGQYALTRQHSTYFWQNIYTAYLPTIAEFNVRYLVQQRFVMVVPFLVIACVFPLNWLIGISLLCTLPIVPLFMIVIGKGASSLHRKHFTALSRLGSMFVDRLKALRLLRIFDAHDQQKRMLSAASDNLNQRTMRVVGVAFLSATVLDFFATLAVALVAVFVGFNLLGEFTLGGAVTLHTGLFLLLIAPLCFSELKQLGRLYHLRAEAIAVAECVKPLFDPSITPAQETIDARLFSHIDWTDVRIHTPQLTADRITLTKSDWVWLHGDSGSGKTCFLEGLMGQRESSHAFVHAAFVSQHAVILPGTIRENLALDHNVSDTEILHAIERVELSDWYARYNLDTVMGEHVPMSGGQQQRLALARVLLHDAPVIFLDEPTAHLTDEQHQRLSTMIRTTCADKTIIWASHKSLPTEWFDRHWYINKQQVTQ